MAQTIGRYEIIKELGRGGMATVYLARDSRIERNVAIKVLPRQFTHDPRFLARFEQEAKTIAALENPAIVPIYDFGEEDDAPFIVMRYMSGGTLRQRVASEPVPLEEIVRILERLGPALDMAHKKGIIHRDLKPDNVLLDREEQPYLADFGIALMAEATSTITVMGTPSYMSPEQVQGEQELDWRSDLYALGVILFELLTGKRPYEATTPTALMYKHAMDPVPDMLALNSDLPPQAQNVIEKAMAKDREERYKSAGEMVAAVKEMIGNSAVLAAAAKTEIDTPPAIQSTAVPLAGSTITLDDGKEQRASFVLPSWILWSGAVVLFLLLVFGVRAWFIGNNNTAESNNDGNEFVALNTPTETPLMIAQSPTPTATITPTSTKTPTATTTPPPTSSATPTLDPNLPPTDPARGSIWQRPRDNMNMVFVPPGSFFMGSATGDAVEGPVHEVSLDGFWIDQTEVTNNQYVDFLNARGNQYEGNETWINMGILEVKIEDRGGVFVMQQLFADHPVIGVSWYGASAYCNWIGGQLPTEAQWEYAARGPESRRYPWGDESPTCELAQFRSCRGESVPAGSKAQGASWVGALDMAGNVWEWVNDWYAGSYYVDSPIDNPRGPESSESKVLRGGSWKYDSFSLRGAYRTGNNPARGSSNKGFRCTFSTQTVPLLNLP